MPDVPDWLRLVAGAIPVVACLAFWFAIMLSDRVLYWFFPYLRSEKDRRD